MESWIIVTNRICDLVTIFFGFCVLLIIIIFLSIVCVCVAFSYFSLFLVCSKVSSVENQDQTLNEKAQKEINEKSKNVATQRVELSSAEEKRKRRSRNYIIIQHDQSRHQDRRFTLSLTVSCEIVSYILILLHTFAHGPRTLYIIKDRKEEEDDDVDGKNGYKNNNWSNH